MGVIWFTFANMIGFEAIVTRAFLCNFLILSIVARWNSREENVHLLMSFIEVRVILISCYFPPGSNYFYCLVFNGSQKGYPIIYSTYVRLGPRRTQDVHRIVFVEVPTKM